MLERLFFLVGRHQLKRAHAVSALLCPTCGEPSDSEETDPQAAIFCNVCHHNAAAAEWAENTLRVAEIYGEAGCPPAGTTVRFFVQGSEKSWEIPASGRLNFQLCAGWLWTLFFACVTLFLGYGLTMGESHPVSKPTLFLILGLFLSPFWAFGIYMIYSGDRHKNARYRLVIDSHMIRLVEEWRGRTKVTPLPLEQVQHIQGIVPVSGQQFHGVEIRGGKTRLRFGGSLTKPERNWLVAEFKAAIWGASSA
jgi:hypothetical protein